MSKRRQQSEKHLPTAIKSKKRKRILNNNEHEDTEVSSNEQRKNVFITGHIQASRHHARVFWFILILLRNRMTQILKLSRYQVNCQLQANFHLHGVEKFWWWNWEILCATKIWRSILIRMPICSLVKMAAAKVPFSQRWLLVWAAKRMRRIVAIALSVSFV